MNIEQLKQQEKELLSQLQENREKQKQFYTTQFCQKYDINLGDTIQFKDGENIITGLFHSIEYGYPIVLVLKSDGKPGKRKRKCYYSSLESIKVIKRKSPENL